MLISVVNNFFLVCTGPVVTCIGFGPDVAKNALSNLDTSLDAYRCAEVGVAAKRCCMFESFPLLVQSCAYPFPILLKHFDQMTK